MRFCCEPVRDDAGIDDTPTRFQDTAEESSLTVCFQHHPDRRQVERYIGEAFARAHGARIRSFMPALLALRDRADTLIGAVGYRPAQSNALFLEQYLDEPIEAALSARTGAQVARERIVEIGNLACRDAAHARQLMRLLPGYLMSRQYAWVVFTGTRRVRLLVGMFEAPLIEICRAEASRVRSGGDHWGDYYDADPRVLAGYLPNARGVR